MDKHSYIHDSYFEDEELEIGNDLQSEITGSAGKHRDPRRAIEILNEQKQLAKDLQELFD